MRAPPATRLIRLWDRLHGLPAGPWLFSRIAGLAIPYTGSMRALVREVRPGFARVELNERRRVRNHLGSIHAIALANLGEFTIGLAVTAAIPPDVRGIPTRLDIEFTKKARGRVVAECECSVPDVRQPIDYAGYARVRDQTGDQIAAITVTWRLSPVSA